MKIHIVFGATGEYDDFHNWPVIAFNSKAKATKYAAKANAEAKALFETFPILDAARGGRIHRAVDFDVKLPLDPTGKMDYTGTTYSVVSVKKGD